MSVPVELAAATAALNANAQTYFDKLEELKQIFGEYPADGTTVEVSPTGDFNTLAEAWAGIRDHHITGPLTIQLDNSVHVINKREVLGPHPWAGNIRIIGNVAAPQSCTIQIEDSAAGIDTEDPNAVHGLELKGFNGIELSGMKFRGSGAASTALGLAATDGSAIYSQPGTLLFEDLSLGAYVNNAKLDAYGLQTTNCYNGVLAGDGGLLRCMGSQFAGQAYGTGVGLKATDGSVIQCYEALVTNFDFGLMAVSGAHMGSSCATARDCFTGFYSRAASHWSYGDNTRTDYGSDQCYYGYRSEEGGNVYAPYARSMNCRQALFADWHAFIQARYVNVQENNTALVPSYSGSAYHIQANRNSTIHADNVTWASTQRSTSYRSNAGTESFVQV